MPYRLQTPLKIKPGQEINYFDIKLDSLRFDKAGIYFRLKAGYEDVDGVIHWNFQADQEVRIEGDKAVALMFGPQEAATSRYEENKRLLYETLKTTGMLPEGTIL